MNGQGENYDVKLSSLSTLIVFSICPFKKTFKLGIRGILITEALYKANTPHSGKYEYFPLIN